VEKPQDIRERAMEYSLRAIELYRHLEQTTQGACWVIGKQFLRSATSIGANLTEARAAESRADFIHKYAIAQKEARESAYWLALLLKGKLVREKRLTSIIKETDELIAIITRIIVNAKKSREVVKARFRLQTSDFSQSLGRNTTPPPAHPPRRAGWAVL